MTALTILSVLPDLTNMNGDVANARVLARRAAWAGIGANPIEVRTGEPLPALSEPDIVVIGSVPDSDVPRFVEELWRHRSALRDWVGSGVGLLAIGTAWEGLSERISFSSHDSLDGLGIFPGTAMWQKSRVSGDLVVESPFGRLIGYENHSRSYETAADTRSLGRVVYGIGNGGGSGVEGAHAGTAIGTHLHGPVLAKNPGLADYLLEMAVNRRHGEAFTMNSAEAARVDAIANSANERVLSKLRLSSPKPA